MSSLSVPLSVLDLSPIVSGSTAKIALRSSVDLAQHCDRLGYARYWMAEHHGFPGVASAATSVLIGQVAAATDTIRVGAGGVMLTNHAPLVIAEQFGTLEAFYPGRIDLGIGRAPGGSRKTTAALRGPSGRTGEDFPQSVRELISYFEPNRTEAVRAIPAEGNRPVFWLLGSSKASAGLAGTLGLPYSFAYHLNATDLHPALAAYRSSFRPSEQLQKPHVMISVAVIAADTDQHAQWIAGPSKLKFLARKLGRSILLPTPEEAASYPYSNEDIEYLEEHFANKVIGSPDAVRKGLLKLLDATDADELMITTRVHHPDDRRRSFELVAELTG